MKNLIGQYEPVELAKQHYLMRHRDENLVNALADFSVSVSWPICIAAEEVCGMQFDSEYEKNAQAYVAYLMAQESEPAEQK